MEKNTSGHEASCESVLGIVLLQSPVEESYPICFQKPKWHFKARERA